MATGGAGGQAFAEKELYTICQSLVKKFEESKAGKKIIILNELIDAVKVLLYGARPEVLHSNFKKSIFDFLCYLTSFTDVLASQSGVTPKSKILIVHLLKLLYVDINEVPSEPKWKRSFSPIYGILQRNLDDPRTRIVLLQNLTFQALDPQSGIPRQSILKIPQTLAKNIPWKFEQAGEISKNLGQWLLVYTSQNPSSGGKKSLFQTKPSSAMPPITTVMEIDGSPCRDIFTILNISKSYLKGHILNIYTFAILKSWLQYAFSLEDINECLTSTISKFPKGPGKEATHSGSPYSFGGSKFYNDDLDSGSSGTESPSLSSSIASSPAFSQFDELSFDQFERRRTMDIMPPSRSGTPSFIASPRKASQAFDTISITSDIFSNASNLKSIAAKYCLRIIVQSERTPQKECDRSVITASVVEAIEILDLLCNEESNFTQKIFTEIKRLYGRLEEKPVSARRVLVALVQFFIHHHEDMMIQIDDVLELLFKEIPTKCYTNQMAVFETYELCLRNADFFKKRSNSKMLSKYVPNFFKFIAWWPCNFVEEACDLLEIVVNPSTAAEVLHLILDLPCLSVALQLANTKKLEDPEKLEETLQTTIRPYYKAMFAFVMREKSRGAETIDKMPELHKLLDGFRDNPLVRYVRDIIPALLTCYVSVVASLDNESVYKKIFPILIERAFQLYPTQGDHTTILQIFGDEIKCIAEHYPEVVSINSNEIMNFLTLFQENNGLEDSPRIVHAMLHTIGDSVDDIDNNTLQQFYNTLEALTYEAVQNFEKETPSILANPEIIQSLSATISKIAAHAQELIQRAVVCLNKVSGVVSSKQRNFTHIQTYAQELMNTLNKPQVAPAVLCRRSEIVPWHLSGDSSLMLKIHVLSRQVES